MIGKICTIIFHRFSIRPCLWFLIKLFVFKFAFLLNKQYFCRKKISPCNKQGIKKDNDVSRKALFGSSQTPLIQVRREYEIVEVDK